MKKSPSKKQHTKAERHYALGNSLYSQGEYKKAAAEYLQALKLNPGFSDVFNNLGNCMNRLGQTEEAIRCFTSALTADPNNPSAYTNLGNLLHKQGQAGKAVGCLVKATELDPKNIPARIGLANVLMELSKYNEAAHVLHTAIEIEPNNAGAHCNLSNALRELHQFNEAIKYARKATEINPRLCEAWHNLAACHSELGHWEESIELFERALEINPQFLASRKALLMNLKKQARYDDALNLVNDLLRELPDDDELLATKVDVLDFMGETQQALDVLLPIIDSAKRDRAMLSTFARLCKPLGRCEEAVRELETHLEKTQNETAPKLVASSRFQLGKTCDSIGHYDQAFENFRLANEIKRIPFHRQPFLDFVDYSISTFDEKFFTDADYSNSDSRRPVFILGMPRSGSSLTEQILASHKDVYGAGELNTIRQIAENIPSSPNDGKEYPRNLPGLRVGQLDEMAKYYLDHIDNLADGERLVTDKLPHNFMHVALISLLFPHAHIIHTIRGPMDTCLSCYFQDFLSQLSFTYRLDDLGFYYRHYARLMEHWKKVVPVPMLTVKYENLIEDTEPQVRRMLDFLELEWDENCLQFHKSKRHVITASRDQVKQPIYKKSKQRWKNYEKYLGPLKEELSKSELGLLD